jgi:hypothetical protein
LNANGIGYNPFGFVAFGDLPVSAGSFNIRAPARGYSSDSGSFSDMGCAMLRQGQHAKSSIRVAQLFSCAACGLALLAQGCMSGNGTRKASSVKSTKNVQSSMPELSSRNQSMLAIYSAEIEVAADRIISESPSPATQRQALVWKAEAIPVMQTSLLNTDPVAAVLDTWAFIFQMTAYRIWNGRP